MKNSISLLKKIIVLLCFFSTIMPIRIEMHKNASKNVNWNFELYNKTNESIVLSLNSQPMLSVFESNFLQPTEIGPFGKLRLAGVTERGATTVNIWQKKDTADSKELFQTAANAPKDGILPTQGMLSSVTNKLLKKILSSIKPDASVVIKLRPIGRIQSPLSPKYHTMFLTWDGKFIRPQTGPFKGWAGTTESGLNNKFNLEIGEIYH
jgi:hypothetical protein